MKFFTILGVAAAFVVICAPETLAAPAATCTTVASKAKITEKVLAQLNPKYDCKKIKVGDKLCIQAVGSKAPSSVQSSAAPKCFSWHTISSGESCWSISKDAGITQDNLVKYNPGLNCSTIQPGQKICTAISSAAPSKASTGPTTTPTAFHCTSYYSVKKNDTCWSIWTAFGQTEDKFMANNPGIQCKGLQLGQQVCVATAAGPAPSSASKSSSGATPTPTGKWGCTKLHAIGKDETCWAISQAAKLTLDTFLSYNPGLDCRFLNAGVNVCIAQGAGGSPPPPIPIYTCTKKGTFAITFDDGPYNFTDALLDYLDTQSLKVTFFINGKNFGNIYDYAKTLKKAFDRGHQIAHHTWSHANISTLNEAALRSEITQLEVALRKIIGCIPTYFRPPFGAYNADNLRVLGAMGYKVVVWDVDSEDWLVENLKKEQTNYQNAIKGTTPADSGHISLQHDPHKITSQQLAPWAVDYVKKLGYKVTTVGDCLGDSDPKNWYRP
ncbi:hypothetical protein BC938DRAFT_474160 [Jimgerdemannia flammicorona]|uniref:NodB homology domain-containing protein n=1 Tax=Jimgerdemannia flammicorona TaxID=994334 RepID=A0A433QSQ9_9FUNG|nr:hypothetical protein BC938DRAFT_474160 [Jimgerdemannia flammicorona]